MALTGAQLWVKALLAEQVDTIFAYPGGQAIDLFDALYGVEGLNVILPRHEPVSYTHLDVHFHYMTEGMVKRLQALALTVDASEANLPDEDDDDVYYYPMITE